MWEKLWFYFISIFHNCHMINFCKMRYYSTPAQIFIAGFLPFIAIYVEVHTLFMSVWGHQVYTLFGILCITFVILLLVTSFVSVLLCYFQLTAEHYNWWWLSLFRGGSCGVFLEA